MGVNFSSSNMRLQIGSTILLAVFAVLTETSFLSEYQQHKKIIIRVPVITHTVYKIINKGHKHAGNVIHHHHHDGHVAHIHKHEGEAHHKHHHHGVADHQHKHSGSADHKHLHAGKAEHGHSHKGHFNVGHHHKGHHGHDHKHSGIFSNAHAHSGGGLHSHGHHSEGGHNHGHFTHLGYGYGNMLDPNRLSYLGDEYHAALMGTHAPLYQHRFKDTSHHTPNPELVPPPPYSPLSYLSDNEVQYRSSGYHGYGTSYGADYTSPLYGKTKIRGGVSHTNGGLGEFAENQKPIHGVGITLKSPMFNLFTPEETAEIENSLHSYEDFASVEEGKEGGSPEFGSHEEVSVEPQGYEDELEKGAFQPVKTLVPFPKRRANPKHIAPIVPYEVTENPHLI